MTTTLDYQRPATRPASEPSAAPPRAIFFNPKRLNKLLTHGGLLLICTGFLLPFFWMLSTSLKPLEQTMAFPPRFVPERVDLWKIHETLSTPVPQNYIDVITSERFDFPRFSRNTLIIATLCVMGTLISSSLVAYGFARIRFPGRGLLFALMLS